MNNSIKEILENRGYSKKKKLELIRDISSKIIDSIESFSESLDETLFCIKNNITEAPVCQYKGCNNKVKFNKSGYYSRGCSKDHTLKISFIEKYGVENPMQIDASKEKLKETMLDKYGVDNYFKTNEAKFRSKYDNPMSNLETRQKAKETFIDRYGVDNPMKNKSIAEKVSQTHKKKYNEYQEKVRKTNIERYGVENPLSNKKIHRKSVDTKRYNNYYSRILKFPNVKPLFTIDEYKGSGVYKWQCLECDNIFSFEIADGKIPICRKCNPFEKNPFSKGEKELVEWLETFNLEIESNDRKILNGKEIDIFLPDYNLAIEYNGLYWHSELSGKKDRNYHVDKLELAKEKNIKLIHILDREWYFKRDIVKSILKTKLGLITDKIYARKCTIREISSQAKNKFLEANHLQGRDNSSIKLGLFYEDKLIQVMTFGKPRFSSEYDYELHRFATKLDTIVLGGAQKLWKYFLSTYKPESVITYSERNWFTGEIYQHLGFIAKEVSPPNPWYHKNGSELYHRMSFQKHLQKKKLEKFDPELTAWENMQLNGYDRIWDSGNYVFEWRK